MPSDQPTRRQLMTAAAVAATQTPGTAAKPNIVLVISDQFRWDCIGAMGLNPMNFTPNLDKMAGRGVMFRQAISNQPVCAPARQHIHRPVSQQTRRLAQCFGLAEDANTLASAKLRSHPADR